jgi:hypothetical protein
MVPLSLKHHDQRCLIDVLCLLLLLPLLLLPGA